jgi:SAM-dependent methyltransferase
MALRSIDFDRVASYYDSYVQTDFDLAFWLDEARRCLGPRLELMCGTGRISLPILRDGLALTCADYSGGQLAVLRQKLAREHLSAEVVQADARSLPWRDAFDLVFIGFHAFAELVTADDQLAALRSIRGTLRTGGRFVCSLHNPAVRGPQLDGQWRAIGTFDLPGTDRRLEVRGRYLWDPASGLADGEQLYRELEADGRVALETALPVRFLLIGADAFLAMARQAGLRLEEQWGSYARAPFEPATSPQYIASLSRE